MQDFRNLQVWQRAHKLTLLVYKLTQDFPRDELFGLRTSMRKTSVDIPAYIAEGSGKASDSEFSRSIGNAVGCASRLEYYTLLAHDLEMLNKPNQEAVESEITEVKKMLNGFKRRLR